MASGINVANLVSSKLRRDGNWNNYMSWKQQMLCLVESQGLVGYIDGKAPPPPPPDYSTWRQTDWLVKGWILGALSDEVLQNAIHHLNSARYVWLDLENAFSTYQSQQAAPPQRINVANFVYTKLSWSCNWNSYMSWKEGMVRLVQIQGLFGFLDGGVPPPPPQDYNSYGAWKHADGVVKGWIMEALSDELVQYVAHLDSAMSVWQEIENEFSSFRSTEGQEVVWREELELYKAARSGDWDAAELILKRNPAAIRKRVAVTGQTALHIAVGSGKSGRFVEELVNLSSDFTLSIRDNNGFNLNTL